MCLFSYKCAILKANSVSSAIKTFHRYISDWNDGKTANRFLMLTFFLYEKHNAGRPKQPEADKGKKKKN